MVLDYSEYFDLDALLQHGDFDIRQVAKTKINMTIDGYIERLFRFVDLAPGVSGALFKFARLDGDRDAYRSLDMIIPILEELGCDRFIQDFNIILDAFSEGDWRLAANQTGKIENEFTEFFSRVIRAKKNNTSDENPYRWPSQTEDPPSLKEFIAHLDEINDQRKMLILAVDDSPVILKTVSSVLSDEYKVFALPKPTMIEKVLSQITPELFLLDYLMPEINGFELVPVIRKFKEHKDTPIIFLTSEGTVDTLTAALALGACDFLVKPFNPDELKERIRKHIVKKNHF